MRPHFVTASIDFGAKYVTYKEMQTDRQMKRQSSEGCSQNTFVDGWIQYRISLWQKSAEKLGFPTGDMDGPTDGWTDRRTDGLTNGETLL